MRGSQGSWTFGQSHMFFGLSPVFGGFVIVASVFAPALAQAWQDDGPALQPPISASNAESGSTKVAEPNGSLLPAPEPRPSITSTTAPSPPNAPSPAMRGGLILPQPNVPGRGASPNVSVPFRELGLNPEISPNIDPSLIRDSDSLPALEGPKTNNGVVRQPSPPPQPISGARIAVSPSQPDRRTMVAPNRPNPNGYATRPGAMAAGQPNRGPSPRNSGSPRPSNANPPIVPYPNPDPDADADARSDQLRIILSRPTEEDAASAKESDTTTKSKKTKEPSTTKTKTTAADEAKIRQMVEQQIDAKTGFRLARLSVQIKNKTVYVQARPIFFWQKRAIRRDIENLPAIPGYRLELNLP